MAHPALKDVFGQLKTRMDKAVEDFRREMAATRTGRANVHMLDTVSVDYYGTQMPLNQIAQIHAPEPQMITVQPFDTSQLAVIEKAIRGGDLGLNPMNDGKMVRVPIPALTEERRKDMVKHLHQEGAERQDNLRGRRETGDGRNPEAHRRRDQEDGRNEQGQREGSAGVQVGRCLRSCFTRQTPTRPTPIAGSRGGARGGGGREPMKFK
jgi:ribosome recycling factor